MTVTTYRAVQTLQVAIDDEDQVIEFFPRRQAQRSQRLGLIHFAVAEDAPDLAALILQQIAMLHVTQKTRLINGIDGTDAHRAGRKLPEVRHQPGVRIRRQSLLAMLLGFDFTAIETEIILAQRAFEKSPRINPGCRMGLKIHQVAGKPGITRAEEMVETNFKQICG